MTSIEDTTNATIVMATKGVTTTIAKAVEQTPDSNIWFAELGGNSIATMTP